MTEGLLWESADPALVASLLAAFVATCGLIAVTIKAGFAEKFSPYAASIAAGLLLATAVYLFQEALHYNDHAAYLVIIGYTILFALNNLFDTEKSSGGFIVPLVAIGLHSFIDGVEYSILFSFDAKSAFLASGGLILHEFAEGVVLFVLLKRANLGTPLAFLLSFIGAAVTTPLGTLVASNYAALAEPEILGNLLALAVGALLYVGTTHLIDHVKIAKNRPLSMLLYLGGVLLASLIAFSHVGEEFHLH